MPKAVNVVSQLAILAEQFGVGRIGAGIAAFDIVDAEIVEHARDRQLVGQREIDAIGLRAVAQRGVEQIKAFAAMALTKDNNSSQRDGDDDRDDAEDDMVAFQLHQANL